MDVAAERIPAVFVAVAMVALALWILWLNFGSRVHRAFALFLGLRGLLHALLAAGAVTPVDYYGRILNYVTIAIPFAAVYLAFVVWTERGPGVRAVGAARVAVPVGLTACAILFELLYAADHARLFAIVDGVPRVGPLFLFYDAVYASYALVALAFGVAYLVRGPAPRTWTLFGFSLAFALEPVYAMGTFAVGYDTAPVGDPILVASYWIEVLTVVAVLGLMLAFLFQATLRSDPALRQAGLQYAAILALPVLAVLVQSWIAAEAPDQRFVTHAVFGALFHLGLVGFAIYAIVRHRFLEADVRVRSGLSHGVVASAFVATFFVFTEGLATFLGNWAENPFVGILATGSLIFAISPLRRIGDRIAKAALPQAIPVEDRTLDERLTLFAEQTRIAWEDGVLTAKERRMLDAARERLGLTEGHAARIERKVLEEQFPARKRRVRAVASHDPWAVRP